jgi:hypothetical protein
MLGGVWCTQKLCCKCADMPCHLLVLLSAEAVPLQATSVTSTPTPCPASVVRSEGGLYRDAGVQLIPHIDNIIDWYVNEACFTYKGDCERYENVTRGE